MCMCMHASSTISLYVHVGGEGQSNPATPGDGSDQLDGDDSIIGDTTPGT